MQMSWLRQKYAEENATAASIDYGDVLFSMNKGDYAKPLLYDDDGDKDSSNIGFHVFHLEAPGENGAGDNDDMYTELLKSVVFEDVCKGRKGAVLVKPDEVRGVPIVRTTTKYRRPAQCFHPVHDRLVEKIQRSVASALSPPTTTVEFNNALIEHYNEKYATMGFHSYQALDLEDDSYIGVFSCYKNPNQAIPCPPRKLIVKSKRGEQEADQPTIQEIPMQHNSVILFSMETNKKFQHKIVLDSSAAVGTGGRATSTDNPWIGVTFRLSKTHVNYQRGGEVYFEDGKRRLILANGDQSREFYKQRKLENQQENFLYPHMEYTISQSDLIPPTRSVGS